MHVRDATTLDRPWRTATRAAGLAGLAAVLLIFPPIIATSTLGEPPFDATVVEAVAFIEAGHDAAWLEYASAVPILGAVALLWFLVGLTYVLGRAEGDPPWRSTIAGASGLILVAYVILDAHWSAAIYRGEDLSPDVIVNAFDLGNLGFANVWLAMASFAAAAAWVSLTTRAFPAWLGWVAAASALGLVSGRFVWTTNLWLAPYALFWIWLIAVSILLLRRR